MANKNIQKILICGDRSWNDGEYIKKYLKKQTKNVKILHGGYSTGVENHVEKYGNELGLSIINLKYVKNYSLFGQMHDHGPNTNLNSDLNSQYEAFRVRNMITCNSPDMVIVFHNDIESDQELSSMLNNVSNTGLRIIVIRNKYYGNV